MNTTELIKKTSKNTGIDEDTVRKVFNGVIDTIQNSLVFGINVKIKGFMSLSLERRESHTRKHPMTGKEYTIPIRYIVKVSLARPFKDKIRNKTVY